MSAAIRNWKHYQHYKHRSPPWVKLHRSLLDDIEYHKLDSKAAKALPLLWLIASERDGKLPDVETIAFRLRITVAQCEAIITALSPWIYDDASAVLAPCLQDASNVLLQSRVEESRDRVETELVIGGVKAGDFDTLATVTGFADAWAAWLDWRKKKRAPVTDRVARNVLTRLSERPNEAVAGLDTCMAAGWTDVRWDWIDNRNTKQPPRQNGYAARDPDAVSPEIKAKQARIRQVNDAVIKVAQAAGRQLSQAELTAVHRRFAESIGQDERRSGVEQAINSSEYGLLARFDGKAG